MNDIDGNFGTDPVDPLSDPILRALVDFEEVVRAKLDQERRRTETAEKSLADARRDLAAAEADLALEVARARRREERLRAALGEYVEDSMRAQRGLIAITRQLLRSLDVSPPGPATAGGSSPASGLGHRHASSPILSSEDGAPPPAGAPGPGVPSADGIFGSKAASGGADHSLFGSYEWRARLDPITDEHRIIDQSNRADMERLDSPSRRFTGSTAFKRKNLLTGS